MFISNIRPKCWLSVQEIRLRSKGWEPCSMVHTWSISSWRCWIFHSLIFWCNFAFLFFPCFHFFLSPPCLVNGLDASPFTSLSRTPSPLLTFTAPPSLLLLWPTNRWVVCPETEVQGHQRGAGPRPQRHDIHVIFNLLHLPVPSSPSLPLCTYLPRTTAASTPSSPLYFLYPSSLVHPSLVSVPPLNIVMHLCFYIVLKCNVLKQTLWYSVSV